MTGWRRGRHSPARAGGSEYGEEHGNGVTGAAESPTGGSPRYVITRPGLLGVCSNSPVDRVRPCREESEALDCSGGTCVMPSQPLGKRCVNVPGERCTTDEDCGLPGFCVGLPPDRKCTSAQPAGSYRDFADRGCSTRGRLRTARGVPAGHAEGADELGGRAEEVWDLDVDPDQTVNLYDPHSPAGYLNPQEFPTVALGGALLRCMRGSAT